MHTTCLPNVPRFHVRGCDYVYAAPPPYTHLPLVYPAPGIPTPTGIPTHQPPRDLGPDIPTHPPPWTEWLINARENITFPQLLLRLVIK